MTDRAGVLAAVALAAVLIGSAVLMPVIPGGAPSASEEATPTATPKSGEVYTPDPQTAADVDRDREELGGLSVVPDSRVDQMSNDRRSSAPAVPESVRASAGTQTMQIETAVVDGEPALVLEDDRTHEGRWVSVSTAWLEEVHGEVPSAVTIEHESGDVYSENVRVRGDSAAFYVREFSSNTVTFSGEISLTGNPADDGTQYQYDVADIDEASDVSVNMTGVMNTQRDDESALLSPGDSMSISVAGNREPTGPSANSEPEVQVWGNVYSNNEFGSQSDTQEIWGANVDGAQMVFQDFPPQINELTVSLSNHPDITSDVDVYLTCGDTSNSYTDGTNVATFNPDGSSTETISFSAWDTSSCSEVTVSFNTVDPNADSSQASVATDGADTTEFLSTAGGTSHYRGDADITVKSSPSNVDLTVDGTTHTIGDLGGGSTTIELPSLTTSASQLDFSGAGGSLDVTLRVRERTETVDPTVELNGQNVSHSGPLPDGDTVSLTINKSHIVEGANKVNVTVGDGTLSSDAPTPQVGLKYSHDAVDRQAVGYSAEQWTSRYNISKSYASARTNATLTVPFDSSDVVSMRAVQIRFNSSSWRSVSSSNYSLDGTKLTTDLSAAYGDDLPAGTTVDVRANASKVDPINGSITVVEASGVDEQLNTKVRVDSVDGTLRIATPDDTIHYAHNASYQTGDYWVADQQGQRLQLPNARSSDTVRVSTLPVVADPETGDVHLTVTNTSATEPAFGATEGQSDNDAVQYTFTNALDGTEYALYSQTHDIVRDSGTASSPLTLEDDDSGETLKFLITDGATSAGGDDPANSGVAPIGQTGGTDWVPLIAVALALGGLAVASRNSETVTNAGADAGESVEGALDVVPVIGPALGHIASGLIQGAAQFARAIVENRTIAVALAGAIGWGAIQAGIIELPPGSTVIVLVAAVSILAAVALRESGQWNVVVWAGITVTTAAMAAILLSDADPIAAVTDSDIFPLVAIGALYLAYRALKVLRDQFGGGGGGDNNEVTVNLERGGD